MDGTDMEPRNRLHQNFARMQKLLRRNPATVRFISAEPLLEDLGRLNLTGIDWVIVGGESGSKARQMQAVWVENILRQCEAAGTAFFFKQWGSWGADGIKRSKRAMDVCSMGNFDRGFLSYYSEINQTRNQKGI